MNASGMVVIVPAELEAGFGLSGVETIGAETHAEAVASLHQVMSGGEKALIAVYEPFLSGLPERERAAVESSLDPVIVPLPAGLDRHDEGRHRARISEMLSRAVGYHITFGQGSER